MASAHIAPPPYAHAFACARIHTRASSIRGDDERAVSYRPLAMARQDLGQTFWPASPKQKFEQQLLRSQRPLDLGLIVGLVKGRYGCSYCYAHSPAGVGYVCVGDLVVLCGGNVGARGNSLLSMLFAGGLAPRVQTSTRMPSMRSCFLLVV